MTDLDPRDACCIEPACHCAALSTLMRWAFGWLPSRTVESQIDLGREFELLAAASIDAAEARAKHRAAME